MHQINLLDMFELYIRPGHEWTIRHFDNGDRGGWDICVDKQRGYAVPINEHYPTEYAALAAAMKLAFESEPKDA